MEEELETSELKEKIDEHLEHAEHASHDRMAPWMRYLSLTTALLAVYAAVTALLSGHYSNDAILQKSDAADNWSEYQAARIKLAIAENQAELVTAPEAVAKSRSNARKYDGESKAIRERAEEHDRESEHMMAKHQGFAITVTLLQIAIALSAIAALTRRKPMWFLALGLTAASIVTFVLGLIA
jgi:hypothetical protein